MIFSIWSQAQKNEKITIYNFLIYRYIRSKKIIFLKIELKIPSEISLPTYLMLNWFIEMKIRIHKGIILIVAFLLPFCDEAILQFPGDIRKNPVIYTVAL